MLGLKLIHTSKRDTGVEIQHVWLNVNKKQHLILQWPCSRILLHGYYTYRKQLKENLLWFDKVTTIPNAIPME